MKPRSKDTDIVIIGGGPAGLAAAIAAGRKGFRVLVADQSKPPVDKACGEGLMPDGVAALNRLGVTIPADACIPFRGIRFVEGAKSSEALFPKSGGFGIRRTVLHSILAQSAANAGVELMWEAKATGITREGVEIGGNRVRCRFVVGADGQNSAVRNWAGLDRHRINRPRFGYRQHFEVAPWSDLVEMYWGRDCQVVITPVSPGMVCAVTVSANPRLRPGDAIASFPALSNRLKGIRPLDAGKGAVSALRVIRAVAHERLALIGDASGSVDSLTGEGLCLAFKQAVFLAEALAAEDLSIYAAAHKQIMRVPVLMSRLLLIMDRHPLVCRRVLSVFEKRPGVFSKLLETHIGEVAPTALNFQGLVGLGFQLLRG